ncbi:unnamed protein product, partial [Darwinula stevensoni]
AILEERAAELSLPTTSLRQGEVLVQYLETHRQVSHLCKRLSSVFHPTLFLGFLTAIVATIAYAFFIISYVMKGSWVFVLMAVTRASFCDFLVFSLCCSADNLSSKADEIVQTLTNERSLSLDKESRGEVVHFESQTRTHTIKLQASRYFTMDKALLTSASALVKGAADRDRTNGMIEKINKRGRYEAKMASVMDWLWILCRLGVFLGILPLEGTGKEERKVTFRVWSVPFVWSMLLVLGNVTAICILLPSFRECFEGEGGELGDRLGFYVVMTAGFGVVMACFFSATSAARKIPGFLEELDETWRDSVGSSPVGLPRSFCFKGLGCFCFYVADTLTVWVAIRRIQHVVMVATVSLMMILTAGFATLFLLVAISCEAMLEERAAELSLPTNSLRQGEALVQYLETHRQVSHLCKRLSSVFHPTLFLGFLSAIVATIGYAFFIISFVMKGSWVLALMAVTRASFCDFLVFSLCCSADNLSSKGCL